MPKFLLVPARKVDLVLTPMMNMFFRVDHLYTFFVQWSPDVYGKDAKEQGFVVVEKEELNMIDNFFSEPTTKSWEVRLKRGLDCPLKSSPQTKCSCVQIPITSWLARSQISCVSLKSHGEKTLFLFEASYVCQKDLISTPTSQ